MGHFTFILTTYITCSFPLEIGKTLPKLSPSSLFSHDDLQTRAIVPLSKRMTALQLYTNDSVDNHSTNASARSADVVDTLRLLYPLLTSLQYTIFTTTHWRISSFQHGVSGKKNATNCWPSRFLPLHTGTELIRERVSY